MQPLKALARAADDTSPGSISNRLRGRRFAAFELFADKLPRPLRVLDVGGTVDYWKARGWAGRDDVHLTLLNLDAEPSEYVNIETVAGDAADLSRYGDNEFDLAFSNSVIEHVGSWGRQELMAREVARVAKHYWIQTPNYWFPLEPHYLIPGWQWLPAQLRVAILQRHSVGQLGKTPNRDAAELVIARTQLLTRRQLTKLFPGAELRPERLGLVKSWTAVR